MTRNEAEAIALMLCTADGGCPVCVRNLIDIARRVWPEFDWDVLKEKSSELIEANNEANDFRYEDFVDVADLMRSALQRGAE